MIAGFDITMVGLLLVALIISIVGHEIFHALAANFYGDDTAKKLNRLSPNPLRHIDPVGTIIVPCALYLSTGFTIGWAKPVPVNMNRVVTNGGNFGGLVVSLAGIFYNLLLAGIFFMIMKSQIFSDIYVVQAFCRAMLSINLILAIFNLYPIPPLDGSKALFFVLKALNLHSVADKFAYFNRYGFFIIIALVVIPQANAYFFAPIYTVLFMVFGLL